MPENEASRLKLSFNEPGFINELSTHLRGIMQKPDNEPEQRVVEYVTLSIQGAINSRMYLGGRDPVDVVMKACAHAYLQSFKQESAQETNTRLLLLHRAVIKRLVQPSVGLTVKNDTQEERARMDSIFTRSDGTPRDFIGSLNKNPNP